MSRPRATATPRAADSWLALAAFAAYAVFFYRDVLLADRVYVFRDLYTLFYSNEHVARLLASWDWPPQWNPFPVLGKPFAADPVSGVYYPPNWLLRLLPIAPGFNLSLVFHHTVAAWGAYLLGRHFALSFNAALLAGLLYGFAGPLVSCDNVYNGLLAAAWSPWIVLAFARWCARPSFTALAATSLALSLSLLGAMPELTLFTDAILVALALDLRRQAGTGKVLEALLAIFAANALAAGLCAVQLLPSAELIAQSSRASGLNVANALQHSLTPGGLLSFVWAHRLAPSAGAGSAIAEVSAAEAPWLLTLYFGPVLLLALVAVLLRPRGRRWWAGLAAVFLALALGENLPGYAWAVEHAAWLRLVRYPEKFLVALHGLLAFAAGWGLDLLAARTRSTLAPLAASGVILFAAADLYRANAQLLPSAPWSEVAAPPASARLMRTNGDPLRIYSNAINLPDLPPYPEGFLLERELLLQGSAALYDIGNANAPMTINLADHEQLALLIETIGRERVAGLMGALNIAYVTSARGLSYPGFELVHAPATPLEAFVYRVVPLAPRAYVPRRPRFAGGAEQALEILRQADAPADEVALETAAVAEIPALVEGQVLLSRYLPSRVELRASMRTAGFVVLADTFAPGWTASLDGAPAAIARANRFGRGVFAGPGEHTIVFAYMPRSHFIGLALTALVALGLCVGLWLDSARLPLRRTLAS